MATVEGLNLRGTRYYLRVLIPEDLQAAYGGKTRVNPSLLTCDHTTAVLRGLRVRAGWLERFAAQRSLQPVNIPPSSSPIELPVAVAPPQPIKAESTLKDIYELWKKAEPRSKDTVQVYARTLGMAEKCLGTLPPLSRITRAQGNTFKAWLQDPSQGLSSKTAKNYFTSLQALLNFARLELEAIPHNPWQGLGIKVLKTVTRRPWKDEELQTLFNQPLFQSYALPTNGRAGGGAAAYWIPLLGLYTGARIGELAQLRVQDISQVDGIPVIQITDADEGQRLKTSASRRRIPIHPELIRLGLLDYVEDIQAAPYSITSRAPQGSLWPLLNASAAQQGNLISGWFSRYRKSIGITDTYPDFHCLRHTVRTKMAHAKVSEQVMDSITGHETGGSTGRKVYQHLQMEDLTTAIQSIAYSAITVPRAYRVEGLWEATPALLAAETVCSVRPVP